MADAHGHAAPTKGAKGKKGKIREATEGVSDLMWKTGLGAFKEGPEGVFKALFNAEGGGGGEKHH